MNNEAPELIYAQILVGPSGHVSVSAGDRDPREVHDNGKPVYIYRRVDPSAPTYEGDKALARQLIESIFKNRGWSNDELVGAICGLLATVRAEVWDVAISASRSAFDQQPGDSQAWHDDTMVNAGAMERRVIAALESARGKVEE